MRIVRLKRHQFDLLNALVILAVFARSLVAPGFMLQAEADAAGSFAVTICHGFKGINAIDGLAPIDQPPGKTNSHHETNACGLWTAGANLITGLPPLYDFRNERGIEPACDPARKNRFDSIVRTCFARAPPGLA